LSHRASAEFWVLYRELPTSVRQLADKSFALLKSDPRHPSLHFKRVGRYWSARVGLRHRAVGIDCEEGVLWFWIGGHAEYDELV
jgi:hypothetical protein